MINFICYYWYKHILGYPSFKMFASEWYPRGSEIGFISKENKLILAEVVANYNNEIIVKQL